MQKCFMFNLLVDISIVISLVGGLCGFVLLTAPRRWIFTKVGLMVWKRWMNGLGDMDMYNRFGKVIFVTAALGLMMGFVLMTILVVLQEIGVFGVGCPG